ncbi:MAG: VanW family protein [Sphingomonadales bacterium]|nr:VanW family protein [Sphingomonadales bacterium]
MLIRARRALRSRLPVRLRAAIARMRRDAVDRARGHRQLLVRRGEAAEAAAFPHEICALSQDIRRSAFWEGKLANIRLGAARLDGVVIAPGAIFSFWALVGAPNAAAGFALGRAIRNDATGGEIGGGLCQLSGIAYELGLRAGLGVAERHAHSRDLYAEHERFTPLGLDATVVWPWKDLRLVNRLPVPLCLRFAVTGMTLSASASAAVPLAGCTLDIAREDGPDGRAVRVSRLAADGTRAAVSADLYSVDQPPSAAR